jgi:hypothetical protein
MDPRYKSPTAEVIDVEMDGDFRDLTRFTNVLVWMLCIGVVIALLSLWSFWLQLDLLSRSFSAAEGTSNAIRVGSVTGLSGLLTIATFVVFGRWIVLAHRNLPALGAQYLEYRPGWAVGWFFIPIANLWKPFQAMRSLWRYSHSVQQPDLQDSTWVLPVWWTLWLVSSFLGNYLMRSSWSAKTVEALTSSTQGFIANSLIDVFQFVIAVILVRRIWKAQEAQHGDPEKFEPAKGFAD